MEIFRAALEDHFGPRACNLRDTSSARRRRVYVTTSSNRYFAIRFTEYPQPCMSQIRYARWKRSIRPPKLVLHAPWIQSRSGQFVHRTSRLSDLRFELSRLVSTRKRSGRRINTLLRINLLFRRIDRVCYSTLNQYGDCYVHDGVSKTLCNYLNISRHF